MINARTAALAVAGLLPFAAAAQDGEVKFWLKGATGNIQGCIAADPRPNVYETDYQLGRMHLHIVADLATVPRSLTVTNRDLGCKWSAVRE